jgi:hypothetical protein
VWAAKTPTVPVQMHVTSFGNQKGLIVTLDDEGGLAVSYLGEYLRCAMGCVVLFCVVLCGVFGAACVLRVC